MRYTGYCKECNAFQTVRYCYCPYVTCDREWILCDEHASRATHNHSPCQELSDVDAAVESVYAYLYTYGVCKNNNGMYTFIPWYSFLAESRKDVVAQLDQVKALSAQNTPLLPTIAQYAVTEGLYDQQNEAKEQTDVYLHKDG